MAVGDEVSLPSIVKPPSVQDVAAGDEAAQSPLVKPQPEQVGGGVQGRPLDDRERSAVQPGVKSNSGYGDGPVYWNQRYREDLGTYDWVNQWQDVAESICRAMEGRSRDQLHILHAGCGNSELTEGMYATGFRHITSIDSSDVVIGQMAQRSEALQLSELRWLCMDATHMGFADGSFDAVIDKCLLDALACAEDKELQFASYLKEVIRVLRPGGPFVCFSLNSERAEQLKAEPWGFHMEEVRHFGKCVLCVCRATEASAAFLADWPQVRAALARGLSPEDLKLVDEEGSWAHADRIEAGDVVEVAAAFLSGDEPADQVALPEGLRGIVRVVDSDGDAVVRFPRLPDAQRVDRFVLQAQLVHLKKRVALGAGEGTGGP